MDISKLMKQAKEMQEKMREEQDKLLNIEVEGSSGAGMVTALIDGQGNIKKLNIDESIIDKSEKEVLEDLIIAALNDAKQKTTDIIGKQMSSLTNGIKLPDLPDGLF